MASASDASTPPSGHAGRAGKHREWKPLAPLRHPGRVTQKPVQTRRTFGTPENSMMESHRQRATAASHWRSAPNLSSGRRSDRKWSSMEDRQALIALILTQPPASGPTSPSPEGWCPWTAPACQRETRERGARGMMGLVVQPHHELSSCGRPTPRPDYKSRRAPGRSLPSGQPASPPALGAGTPLTCRGRRRCCPGAAATPATAVGSVPLLVLRHRGPPCAAYTWELSEDQPMELHCLLVRLCGGRLRGESRANKRGEERRG